MNQVKTKRKTPAQSPRSVVTPAKPQPLSPKGQEHSDGLREVHLELVKAKLEERERLQGDYFRTTSLALLVLGACLKFSIDSAESDKYQLVLPVAGLLFTIIGLVSLVLGNVARHALEKELQALLSRLGVEGIVGASLRLKFSLAGLFCSGLVLLAGFAYVLLNVLRPS